MALSAYLPESVAIGFYFRLVRFYVNPACFSTTLSFLPPPGWPRSTGGRTGKPAARFRCPKNIFRPYQICGGLPWLVSYNPEVWPRIVFWISKIQSGQFCKVRFARFVFLKTVLSNSFFSEPWAARLRCVLVFFADSRSCQLLMIPIV